MTCREERPCEKDRMQLARHVDRVEKGAQVMWPGGLRDGCDLCKGQVAGSASPSQISSVTMKPTIQ